MGKQARAKAARRDGLPPWTPFQRASRPNYAVTIPGAQRMMRDRFGLEVDAATAARALERIKDDVLFVNSRYQVAIREIPLAPGRPPMLHLSIKRRDRARVGPERFEDFQRIKDELVGPDCEAAEIYPARERLVDVAHQYHLWAIKDPEFRFPFGFGDQVEVEAETALDQTAYTADDYLEDPEPIAPGDHHARGG